MRRSKAPDFVERRNAATNAKKTALEKFRAHAGDPGLAERQTARVALAGERTAAKKAREICDGGKTRRRRTGRTCFGGSGEP